ncbi:hypothetical protein H2198_004945 [Neophaeococcomyces mojaviensis]|uniref:Uncharacterized protein n=1 Tax=Neophaeococcomyces mojaviensis TaxID=3383035 RepID=A0ACC3A7F0_9EURO|nr:hypothetical protein H2198_004945 [Knufia sp. JES_112]
MLHSELLTISVSSSTPTSETATETPHEEVTVEILHSSASAASNATPTLVLFLPFWGGSASTFNQLLPPLASTNKSDENATITCLSLSYPGTAASPHPTPEHDAPEQHSIVSRAKVVEQVLRSKKVVEICGATRTANDEGLPRKLKLVIVAHSMSAKITYVLLDLLASQKNTEDRLGGNVDIDVEALVLVGPAPIGPLILPPDMREQQLHAYDTVDSARWTLQNILTSRTLDEKVLHGLAADCVNMSPGAKAGWLQCGMPFDCLEYVRRAKDAWRGLQVQVVLGREDKVESVERVQAQTVEVLRRYGFEVRETVVEGCGHLLPVEAVAEMVEVVRDVLRSEHEK